MAEIVWSEPALTDLDSIADYIALDKPAAASALVRRIFSHVEQLSTHPDSGSKLAELHGARYRQIVEPPCRVIYRHDGRTIYIVCVMRGERQLTKAVLKNRDVPNRRFLPLAIAFRRNFDALLGTGMPQTCILPLEVPAHAGKRLIEQLLDAAQWMTRRHSRLQRHVTEHSALLKIRSAHRLDLSRWVNRTWHDALTFSTAC